MSFPLRRSLRNRSPAETTTTPSGLVSLEELASSDAQRSSVLPPPSPSQVAAEQEPTGTEAESTGTEAEPTPIPQPPPPEPPRWKCHSCGCLYRFSVTRRCLSCSHRCCSKTPFRILTHQARTERKRGGRCRGGTCKTFIDTNAWREWGNWRRSLSLPPGTFIPGASLADCFRQDLVIRDALFQGKKHNCEVHCDLPLECRDVPVAIRTMREQARRKIEEWNRRMEERRRQTKILKAQKAQEARNEGEETAPSPVREVQEPEEDDETSWFSDSGSSSSSSSSSGGSSPSPPPEGEEEGEVTEEVLVAYLEDRDAEPAQEMDSESTGPTSQEEEVPVRLTVIADGRGSPVFSMPVSPESPIENPGEVFLGTGMDSDEWAEEVALMGSIGRGITQASSVSGSEKRSGTELANVFSDGEDVSMSDDER